MTSLLARSLREEDWLGSSGPRSPVVLSGGETAAKTAAERLAWAVALEILDAVGHGRHRALSMSDPPQRVPPLRPQPDVRPAVAGTVIRYREPLA